jgi:hypothetical protein
MPKPDKPVEMRNVGELFITNFARIRFNVGMRPCMHLEIVTIKLVAKLINLYLYIK